MNNTNRMILLSMFLAILAPLGARGEIGAEAGRVQTWAAAALGWETPAPKPAPPLGLEVRRQDYNSLNLRKSVLGTSLKIGQKGYQHGLGTHSISEIIVRLPQPGKQFQAEVGIDNNYDTAGKHGTVIFAVEVAGKEVFRSKLCRGGEEPLPVQIDLNGSKELILRVLDGGDGPFYDQSDWAAAAVTLEDGKQVWLDELPVVAASRGLATAIPFSFLYGQKSSAQLLGSWKRTHVEQPGADGRQQHTTTFTDPETGLEVTCEAMLFAEFPAVEWVLRLRNTGTADTPILENIQALDLRAGVPEKGPVVLHHAHGSTCAATDFLPLEQPLLPNKEIRLAPNGGRSSDGCLPFFNLQWQGGGLVAAIGWSGQWALRLHRGSGGEIALQAGQHKTHLKLRPGESIRIPRILLVLWQGDDPMRGHNLLRRLLLAHYVPRLDDQPVLPPVSQNTWFVFNSGNAVTEANQLDAMRQMARLGVELYWLDAGWFEGGWPSGVGSWFPRADAFPRGLKPLGDESHKLGMKFIVWFEPERVSLQSRIGKEHTAWVLRAGGGDGLFNLGIPEARQWLAAHLSKTIKEAGIDIYRNDFNIDPLRFWQKADAPDRQGMTEIRYIEGLYALWDELRRQNPGLAIDDCASGGRRIDLEMISRSMPLWRSDTQCCGKAMPVQDQVQTAGLSLYVPLHAAGCWSFRPYEFRSVATTGLSICPDLHAKDFPADLARQAVEEVKSLRPLYQGDYYPLLPITQDESHWCAWQFDRPEMGRGFAMFFRRAKSPYVAVDAGLRGLESAATYEVSLAEDYQPKEKRKMSGTELARLRVEIGSAPGSLLVTYRKSQ